MYFLNGKKAWDGFHKEASFDNGNKMGSSGINYSAQNVSMNIRDKNQAEFRLTLGNHFYATVDMNGGNKEFKLFNDGRYVVRQN